MISTSVGITGISIIFCACLMAECWCLKQDLDLEKTLHQQDREFLDRYMRESIDDAETIMEWQNNYYNLLGEFKRYIDEHDDNKHHVIFTKKEMVTNDNKNNR